MKKTYSPSNASDNQVMIPSKEVQKTIQLWPTLHILQIKFYKLNYRVASTSSGPYLGMRTHYT